MPRRIRFRDLPLLWKLLIPFLGLMLFVGAFGVIVIVRDLSSRAETALDQELSRLSLDARSVIRARELYLLESANFAANVEGMVERVRAQDRQAVARLLQSVLALKTDLNLLVVTDADGTTLAAFGRTRLGGPAARTIVRDVDPAATAAVRSRDGRRIGGWNVTSTAPMLAIVAPICATPDRCVPIGAAVAGFRADRLATEVQTSITSAAAVRGVTIFDGDGSQLARIGISVPSPGPGDSRDRPARRVHRAGETEVATIYAPLSIGAAPAGTVAVTTPTAPVFASARDAAVGLALILLAAMLGVIGLGAFLSRTILRQVRPLVDTNRALGRGDLAARAPVMGADELGELAEGVNQMAEQLQASYETLELRVAQRTEEVQRLLRERTEMFAGISHEFRTPLAIILGQIEMMRDGITGTSPDQVAEGLGVIGGSANQLLTLVNEILDLARFEAGRMMMTPTELAIHDVVAELRPTLLGLTSSAELHLSHAMPPDLPSVRADGARLREIIVNLVDNAVKYTPPGGGVELAARAEGDMVAVAVSDTGIGIPTEAGERIFEPFYRVEDAVPQRGQAASGLGLALTKRLVEAQGGQIRFESQPGRGSTFTFTVPVARPATPTEPGRARRRGRRGVESSEDLYKALARVANA